MIGLILSILYGLWLSITGAVFEVSFYQATKLLFYWYLFWSIILTIPILALSGLMGFIGAAAANEVAKGKIGGKVLALAIGASFSAISLLILLVRNIFLVLGAYLLNASLMLPDNWDAKRLIIGGLTLFIALIIKNK